MEIDGFSEARIRWDQWGRGSHVPERVDISASRDSELRVDLSGCGVVNYVPVVWLC